MQRFNIALLPSEPAVQKNLVQIAQQYFGPIQDGYMLGESALAHVTLCQFYAFNESSALNVFHTWSGKKEFIIKFNKFHFRAGHAEHAGKWWAEFLVDKDPELLQQQQNCWAHITRAGLTVLTPAATYSPHLTLARIPSADDVIVPTELPPNTCLFRPAAGLANENGVFVKALTSDQI